MGELNRLHNDMIDEHNMYEVFLQELKFYCKEKKVTFQSWTACDSTEEIDVFLHNLGLKRLIGSYYPSRDSELIDENILIDCQGYKHSISLEELIKFGATEED